MPNLLECMAEKLGISVDELVGVSQIKADLASLSGKFQNYQIQTSGLLNSLAAQVNSMRTQVESLLSDSVTKTELNNYVVALDGLSELVNENYANLLTKTNSAESAISSANSRIIALQNTTANLGAEVGRILSRINSIYSVAEYHEDLDLSVEWSVDSSTWLLKSTLTAGRAITIGLDAASEGAELHFVHLSPGGFPWDVNGIKTLNLNDWCTVVYNNQIAAWELVAAGTL